MSDTKGIHLSNILDHLKNEGKLVSWPGYFKAAERQGWKEKTVLSRLHESISEIYGSDWYDGWKQSYDHWKEKQE